MAQYDGAVRVNTAIDTTGFDRGSAELQQATARLQRKFESVGKQLEKSVGQYQKALASGNAKEIQRLSSQLQNARDAAAQFAKELTAFQNASFRTDDYKEIQAHIEAAQKALDRLLDRQAKMDATGVKQNSKAYQALQYDIEQARIRLQDAQNDMQWYLDSEQSKGEEPFKGADTAQFDAYKDAIDRAHDALDDMEGAFPPVQTALSRIASTALRAGAALLRMASASIINGFRLIGQSAAEAARQITRMTATAVSGGIKRLGAWLSSAAKSMTLFGRSARKNNNVLKKSFTTILKYGLGVRSFYFLFRKIRQAIGEGYQNLARYSDTLNQSISGVISSFKKFENQFAASFEPLVNTIAPAITNLINSLTEGTYRVGEFIAALSGQKTVIRAKEVQEDYAESLDKTKKAAKEAERQLAGFDQLNILKKQGDEGTKPEDMFETVPVEDEAKDFADAVKDAWVNVDLTGIGEIVGGKIKVALDNIPWPDIKQGAENMGKRLATFLNGLINVPGLGKSLGKSIAEAINTAFSFLDGFVWHFDWKGLGNAIMDAVEAACDNLDWDLINHALQGLAIGLADLLNTIFSRVEVWEKIGRTIGKGLNAAVSAGITFLERFDFNQAASAIVTGLNAAIDEIEWDKIGRLIADSFGGALQFIRTALLEFHWADLGTSFAEGLNEFVRVMLDKILHFEWEQIGTGIADGINVAVSGIGWNSFGTLVGRLIGGALKIAASFIRGLDYKEIMKSIQEFISSALRRIDYYDLLTVWGVAALIVALKTIFAQHPVLTILVGAILALGPELGKVIHKMVETIPWEEVGQQISDFLISTLNRLNEAVASVNWSEIGVKVGVFLGNIDWASIIGEVVELIMNVLAHGLELIAGVIIGLGPEKILKAIGAVVAAILAGIALMGIAAMILSVIMPIISAIFAGIVALLASPAVILAAIATLIAGIVTYLVKGKKDAEDAGSGIGEGILYGIGKWFFDIAGWIKKHIFQPFLDAWHNLWKEHSPSKIMEDEGGLIIAGLFNGISAAWHTITDFFSDALDGLRTTLGGAWDAISGAASEAWNGISTTLGGIVGGITETVSGAWESVKTATSDKWREVTTALGTTWESVKTEAGDKWNAVKETVSGAWGAISRDADGALKDIAKGTSDKWNEVKTNASKVWGDIRTEIPKKAEEIKTGVVSKVRELASQALPFWRQTHTDAKREWKQTETDITQSANNVKTRVVSAFQSIQGILSGIWGSIRSAASGAMSSIASTVGSIASSISSRMSAIRSSVGNMASSASDALSKVADKMDRLSQKTAGTVGAGLASGGFVTDSGRISWWDSVRKYASGTLRAAGSLFVAGEAGPEIVGHVNGRTEVLNQSQIAGAIYGAVLSAMAEAVKTLGGFLSQQMATNTNALIAAIGQIQAPQQIAAPQDTALTERLAALSAVPYQVPAYATGTVMPYEVVAEIRRQTSEITSAIYDNGQIVISAVASAISNHGLAIADAISRIPVNQGQNYSPDDMARYTVDYINRQTRMTGKSPLHG